MTSALNPSVEVRQFSVSTMKITREATSAGAASTRLRGVWRDLHVVAHFAQAASEMISCSVMVQLVEIIRSQFAIIGFVGEHVIGRHQYLMGNRDRRAHRPASCPKASVLIGQISTPLTPPR
jgi:hypothetical protein